MWKYIAAPLVGAVIGYLTNWIAVKMLFHPRHEVKIGGWRLPMTPGVIPRGQPRLARAVGRAVEDQLLTSAIMKKMLLSQEMKERLTNAVRSWVEEKKTSQLTWKATALSIMDEESFSELKLFTEEYGADYLLSRLRDMQITQKLTARIMDVAQEKLSESVFGMMLGGGFLESIGELLEEKLNEYMEEKGQGYLERLIAQELSSLESGTVGGGFHLLEDNGFNLVTLTLEVYELLIEEHIDTIMSSLHLSRVVEERMNSMKVEELESLVLSVMKKELGTIVNLGAIIGFVLGLFNVLIMCI